MQPLKHIAGEAHVALTYGMEEAVFLDTIIFWYRTNRANARPEHFHDGRYWTYNSVKAFEEIFPWWNGGQIRRIIARCKEKGALLAGNYNKDQRDRTVWYSPSDALLGLYGEPGCGNCNCQNQQMQEEGPASTSAETGEALPRRTHGEQDMYPPCSPPNAEPVETAPVDKPKGKGRRSRRKASVPIHAPERFEQFWKAYPGGGSRLKAVAAWDALAPDHALIDEMALALKRQMRSQQWQDGVGIPHASTWLNDCRWTDKLPEAPQPRDAGGGWAPDPEAVS